MEKVELFFEIFGIVVGAASAIIALFPKPTEGSKYARFISWVDKLSILYAQYKKK